MRRDDTCIKSLIMKRKFVFIGLLSLCSFSFCNYVSSASADGSASDDKDKKEKKKARKR